MATLDQLLAIQSELDQPGGASIDELLAIQQELDAPQAGATGRAGRAQRRRQEVRLEREAVTLLDQLEAGDITSQDLTPEQVERVRKARIERIPEVTDIGIQNLSENAGFLEAIAGISTFNDEEFGRILRAADPNIGIVTTPEGEQIAVNNETGATASLNKLGPSLIDAARGVGIAGAFTPAGRAAAAAPQVAGGLIGRQVASPTGVRALAGAAGAGLTETSLQALQAAAGGEFDENEIALAAALGGGAELAVPTARALLEQARRFTSAGAETAEQAARRTALEAEGLTPTRAQVTRDTGEFQTQQELAKQPGAVRARLDQQEARLQGAFEQRAIDTQGNVVTSTSTPIDEVLERSISLDEEIGQLYQQARQAAPEAQNIRLQRLAGKLKSLAGEENISGGLISSVRNNLKNRGIIDDAGRVSGRISVDVAEQVRQDINSLFDSVTDRGKQLSRVLKDSLDDDVLKQSGEDLFEVARSAKSEFESGLNRAQISKFDKRKQNLVRDMLDNKINPDTFINDVMFAKKWRKEDINQLRVYLNQTESGKQAWNDIRAQTFDQIKERSFKGPVRQDGTTQSLSRDALNKTLVNLKSKLDVLFTTEERDFLKRMQQVARLREPPPATFTGKGPSAQAVRDLKARMPFVGDIFDSLSNFRQNKLLLRLPKKAKAQRPRRRSRSNARAAQAAQQPRAGDE